MRVAPAASDSHSSTPPPWTASQEKITEFVLMTKDRPMLEVVAFDVLEFAFGGGIPAGIDGMIPIERAGGNAYGRYKFSTI